MKERVRKSKKMQENGKKRQKESKSVKKSQISFDISESYG